jgi:hypothetical protein
MSTQRHIFVYEPDEGVFLTRPPALRSGPDGQLEIMESVCETPDGEGNRPAWHPVEKVTHLGEWVALTYTYRNPIAGEAFRALAVVPAEIYYSTM